MRKFKSLKVFSTAILLCTLVIVVKGNGDENPRPDNTVVNQRDPSKAEVTAQDQGNSKENVAMTRKIRQEVVKSSGMSSEAKNIKIITVNGEVTLKGPVKSAEEKAKIEQIARTVTGDSKVRSQIEITND